MNNEEKIQNEIEKAKSELENFKLAGATIHRTYIADDGWLMGNKTLYAIVELPVGEIVKLCWNGRHAFFKKHISGGSSPFSVEDMRPRKAIIVTKNGSKEVLVKDLVSEMRSFGRTKIGTTTNELNKFLDDLPEFDDMHGPMQDGERVRYEDWETYRTLSA